MGLLLVMVGRAERRPVEAEVEAEADMGIWRRGWRLRSNP